MDINRRQQVDFSENQKEPDIDISKNNLAPGLPTLDKTLKLTFRAFLLPPTELLSILVKKKLYYKIVPTKEAKLKKKINGNIKKQNIVIKKGLKSNYRPILAS